MVDSMFSHLPNDHRIYAGGMGKTVPSLVAFIQDALDRRCGRVGTALSDRIILGTTSRPLDDARPLHGCEREVFGILGLDDVEANRVALRQARVCPSGPFISPELAETIG